MFSALNGQLSTEDRAVMDVLPATDLPGWMATRIEDYRSRIRALMSAQNALVPINHNLPPEVLMEIFIHVNTSNSSRVWLRVLHVCRLWRSLIFRTPAFWVAVLRIKKDLVGVTEGSVARLNLFLALSRTLPLDLSFKGLPHSVSQALAPHINRISTLTLKLKGKEYKSFTRLLGSGMARLEQLCITHRDDDKHTTEFHRALVKDASHLPRLRSLTLRCVLTSLGGLAGQLRHLKLSDCYCTYCHINPASLQGFLKALEGCSSLEVLVLEDTSMVVDNQPPVIHDHVVALPTLRKLQICRGELPVAALLSRVSLPKTCTVNIDTRLGAHHLRDTLPRDLHGFFPVSQADRLLFEYDPMGCGTLKSYTGESMLVRTSATGSPGYSVAKLGFASFVAELRDLFSPFNNVTALILRTPPALHNATDEDRAALRALLGALPLAHLDATAYNGTNDVLSLLGETLPAGGSLCPSLEGLTLRWRFSVLNEYRKSCTHSWLYAREPPKPPAPLRTGSEALGTFCDAVANVVEGRENVSPLKMLRVVVHPAVYLRQSTTELKEKWDGPTKQERERLQLRLGHLVGSITVEYDGGDDSI